MLPFIETNAVFLNTAFAELQQRAQTWSTQDVPPRPGTHKRHALRTKRVRAAITQGSIYPSIQPRRGELDVVTLRCDLVAYYGGGMPSLMLSMEPRMAVAVALRPAVAALDPQARQWAQRLDARSTAYLMTVEELCEPNFARWFNQSVARKTWALVAPIFAAFACAGVKGLTDSLTMATWLNCAEGHALLPQAIQAADTAPPTSAWPTSPVTVASPSENTSPSTPPQLGHDHALPPASRGVTPAQELTPSPPRHVGDDVLPTLTQPIFAWASEPLWPPALHLVRRGYFTDLNHYTLQPYRMITESGDPPAVAHALINGISVMCDEAVMRGLLGLPAVPSLAAPQGQVVVTAGNWVLHDSMFNIYDWLTQIGPTMLAPYAPTPEPEAAPNRR